MFTPRRPDSDCPARTPPRLRPGTPCSAHTYWLALGRACLSRGHDRTVPRNGSGEPARAWSPAWRYGRWWIPAMASSQGDVSTPMAYPAVRPLREKKTTLAKKTPATSTARHGPLYLLVRVRVRPERHRAQSCAIGSPSGHPLLSGPPILNDSEVARGLSLFGGASSEVRRCSCSVVD